MAHDVRSPHIFQDGPGNNASGEQVMDNYDALWTKIDTYEPTFANYKPLGGMARGGYFAPGHTAGTYILQANTNAILSTTGLWTETLYFNPAEYAAGARTAKCRVRAVLATGDVPPTGTTFTIGLAVATFGIATHNPACTAGVDQGHATFGGPAASTPFTDVSADLTLTAGYYVLYATTNLTLPANCNVIATGRLEMRQT
jgi:hypothetical protein